MARPQSAWSFALAAMARPHRQWLAEVGEWRDQAGVLLREWVADRGESLSVRCGVEVGVGTAECAGGSGGGGEGRGLA